MASDQLPGKFGIQCTRIHCIPSSLQLACRRCSARGSTKAYLRILLIPLKILPVNEGLNALLQVLCPYGKLELDKQLLHQQFVAQALASLHDPHYCSINLHHTTTAFAEIVIIAITMTTTSMMVIQYQFLLYRKIIFYYIL